LPVRARVIAVIAFLVAGLFGAVPGASPAPAAAGGPKVVVIVGPVGSLTDNYRARGDSIASAAEDAGATVVKVYSPNATWTNVRNAVNGANVIAYVGHGNGYPNPYTPGMERTDRVNGFGLNRIAGIDPADPTGDGDNWSTNMAYCGEKALLGQLTTADDAVRLAYCGGTANDGISPAPGFVMVHSQAHYTAGFGERYEESDPITTLSEAQQRVRNYSYPVLALGASAYYATAYGDADEIVERVLTQPNTAYGPIFAQGEGYSPSTLTTMNHPDIGGGAQIWVQRTERESSWHFGDPDYWYAFAGNPTRTPDGGSSSPFSDVYTSKFYDDIVWLAEEGITSGCGNGRFCPNGSVTRGQMASFLVRAFGLPTTGADFFSDDNANKHEVNINRLAAAGITSGCDDHRFCPDGLVTRAQMATFLAKALELGWTNDDYFSDDDGNLHEANINRFAEAGITSGCGGARYCPDGLVTRGQMAAFLHRALE
jgi:hypothetical protein